MRLIGTTFLALALAIATAAPAQADPVADGIRDELVAKGLPGVTVNVATPAAATDADAATFADDPTTTPTTITPENALSPDPAHPQAVVTVTIGATATTQVPGTITPPGEPGLFMNDAQTALWDADIMQAVKHAVAGGAQIAGVIAYPPPLSSSSGTRDATQPFVYAPNPDPSVFPATPTATTVQAMTTGAIQLQFANDMPEQYWGAPVTVADAPGGQRVVTIQADRPAEGFMYDDLSTLTDWAAEEQVTLNDPMRGANIGQVIVRSRDTDPASPTYNTTIFERATDATWGEQFDWSSPGVAPFADPAAAGDETG